MAVTIRGRLSRPEDWVQVKPGEWHVIHTPKGASRSFHLETVAFGNSQCVVCGEPIEITPGECDKCNECWAAIGRHKPDQDNRTPESHLNPPTSWAGLELIRDGLLFSPKRLPYLFWAGCIQGGAISKLWARRIKEYLQEAG